MPNLRAKSLFLVLACWLCAPIVLSLHLHAKSIWSYHQVKKGENLTSIARKFDVQVSDVVRWNSLRDANHIFVGQKLKIQTQSQKGTPSREPQRSTSPQRWSSQDAKSLRLKRPVTHWRVELGYRTRGDVRHYGLLCHIPGNSSIFPAHEGKIAKVGHMRGYGKYILIDHGSGWHSMYSNLRQIFVKPGQYVSLKDSIGAVENDKLFFLLAYQGKPVNPTGYFR